ncbi:MAG TPA: orotidine-5'-phosphate decarboxylase [Acidimicrobiales bacterium]|nr:orotidine-5'-phosphate decarboxylase [Acidimicrobiales bacterium]
MTPQVTGRGARKHLALALDVDNLSVALDLAEKVGRHFAVAKIGLELFIAEGPASVRAFQALGYEVFLDLKLHDIPTTVRKAARTVGRLGVRYVTVHAQGGGSMLEAAADGLRSGALDAGFEPPMGLGITVLTSDPTPDEATLWTRATLVRLCGLGGLVCAAPDLATVRAAAPGLVTVVPGTRPSGAPTDDQERIATAADAVRAGADLLVIGRAVTAAEDPEKAAASIEQEVIEALSPQ